MRPAGRLDAAQAVEQSGVMLTWWNRVEARPRATEISEALAARVRDPLWFLTRQWQAGEFHGEDAGSPAYVQLSARTAPVLGWRADPKQPLSPITAPLEELVETEGFTPDLETRMELGHLFEVLLGTRPIPAATRRAIVKAFRTAYPLTQAGVSAADARALRLFRVCQDRTIDGAALAAAHAGGAALPADPDVAANAGDVTAALDALMQEALSTLGSVGTSDAPAWRPEQLEYRVDVVTALPGGSTATLAATPDRDATFEWYAFDLAGEVNLGAQDLRRVQPKPPTEVPANRLPTHVRFHGMPNPRWWDFERGGTDFGAVAPDRRDLAKLLMMDFMLIHGNDWFAIPYDQEVGTTCHVDLLLVHDVFGGITLVDRADAAPAEAGQRWTCFTIAGADGAPADFFLLPPSAGSARIVGEVLEEVRFVRDEQANYAWGIEHTTEGGDGRPWSGHERSLAESTREPALAAPATDAPLLYQLQSFVPRNWFPLVPVSLDPNTGETAFEVGRMVRPDLSQPEPAGRVLRPAGSPPYRLREEAVPRVGARVVREPVRSRWLLGATHLWLARRRLAGRGEGSSGLRYDRAVVQGPRREGP